MLMSVPFEGVGGFPLGEFQTDPLPIRNVPEALHRTLRSRAAAAGVSLSDYALGELRRSAERPEISEVLRRADSRSGRSVDTTAIVAALQSGRGERD